jgi:hypothetical protein
VKTDFNETLAEGLALERMLHRLFHEHTGETNGTNGRAPTEEGKQQSNKKG